jgi:site-specific recombinase XerC
VVLRNRFFLEQKNLAPATIHVRLAAVRRLAYEASDTGLLSPDLAAGIRRGKGTKMLGVRIGNWLSVDESKALLRASPSDDLRGKRDRAILAILIGCRLRRAELVALKREDFQIREEHCVIADLIGKGKHIRTVPVPAWVKQTVDAWIAAAGISGGTIFRGVSRLGKLGGDGLTPKAIWHVVKGCAARWHQESCPARFASHLRAVVSFGGRRIGADTIPPRPRLGSDDRAYLGCKQKFHHAVNDNLGLEDS